MGRFLAIALQLGLVCAAIVIAGVPRLSPLVPLFAVINAIPFWAAHDGIFGYHYHWHKEALAQHRALHQLVVEIEGKYPAIPVLSCPSILSREVEYALPSINGVQNCNYFIGQFIEPALPDYQGNNDTITNRTAAYSAFRQRLEHIDNQPLPVRWTQTLPNFLLVDNPLNTAFPNFGRSPLYKTIHRHCHTVLFNQGGYQLKACDGAAVMQAFVSDGISFMPDPWQERIWIQGHRL